MDEQRNTALQSVLDVDGDAGMNKAKKKKQRKWMIGGIVAVVLICIIAIGVLGSILGKPTNFLNIKWDSKPEDAVKTITSKIEKAGVKYRILAEDDTKVDIDMSSDPFFGQTNVSPGMTVEFKNDTLTGIRFLWLGETVQDYESVVQNITKEFGKPEGSETSKTMEAFGGGRETVWHLKSTDITVKLALGMVFVEFSPCE